MKPLQVARCLRVSRKSAYRWHQLWRVDGARALASRGPSGSRCRLSPRCLEKLAAYLEQRSAAHGWVEDQVWTAARSPSTTVGEECSPSGHGHVSPGAALPVRRDARRLGVGHVAC
ncbi:leucine zipper domain-containing protein [Streptomyces spiralis]